MYKEKIRSQILDGALKDYPKHLEGCYRGYYTSFQIIDAQFIIQINAHSEMDTNNVQLNQYLLRLKDETKDIIKVTVLPYSFTLQIRGVALIKSLPERINTTLSPIFQYLLSNQYISGCGHCGKTNVAIKCYEVNGICTHICDSCKDELQVALETNKEAILSKKSNLLPGLVGAILGSIIGGVVWILIYKLGYIAGIAGAITAICAMKGYELFGKHMDRKGIIISVIVSLGMIYIANKLAWTWEAYDVLSTYGWTFSDCFKDLGEIIEETSTTVDYFKDLIIGYVLTIVCSINPIIQAYKASKGNYTIK